MIRTNTVQLSVIPAYAYRHKLKDGGSGITILRKDTAQPGIASISKTSGEAIPSVRSLAKSLHISILTVQKAYATLQEDGFIETTAGKGCYVSAQNQDFYLEEQQKKIEGRFAEAIEIARASGISFVKLVDLLTILYQEDE